ncbi:MAG: phospholipase D-like domain-containing protein [Ignavibacteria bacterium]|nr:phospholipase D-like domain-containing protein [Ignavibacteria bacterium]
MIEAYINNPRNSEIKDAIINAIKKAEQEIVMALYIFTDKDIMDALSHFIVSKTYSKLILLLDSQNIPNEFMNNENYDRIIQLKENYPDRVFYKIMPSSDSIMHHKIIIIDRFLLGLGSYNYSSNAHNYNYESYVFITADENPYLIKKFHSEIYNIMNLSQYAEPVSDIRIKTVPVIQLNKNNTEKHIIINHHDTNTFIYPIQIKLIYSGKNIYKVTLNYEEHSITKNYNGQQPDENYFIFSPNYSQNIKVTFTDWNGSSVTLSKFIHVHKKSVLSTQAFEIFYNTSQIIVTNHEKFTQDILQKHKIN